MHVRARVRVHAAGGDGARHLEDIRRREVAQGGALHRDQRVDRDLVGVGVWVRVGSGVGVGVRHRKPHRLGVLRQARQLMQQPDAVRLRLAWLGLGLGVRLRLTEAEDAAAADRDARLAHLVRGRVRVWVRVRETWRGAARCGRCREGQGLAHVGDGLQPLLLLTTTTTTTPTAHVGDGLQAVVVGSGGDDLGVVLARGVEVMVVGVEARVLELHRLASGW
eukprot:scaffold83591_cov30-Phaeocystis_antarctica.AAC.1